MTKMTLAYAEADGKVAARLRADLEAEGIMVVDTVQTTDEALTVVVLSKAAREDQAVQQAIVDALDNGQHVIPVLAESVPLPDLIDNLQPMDFSTGYDRAALLRRVKALSGPDAPKPMVTHTPSVRRSNARAGLVLAGLIGMVFVVAIIGVLLGVFIPPADEFAGVETQIFLTRNWYIDAALPKSTEDVDNFQVTLDEARETVRPFLILTATGMAVNAESTFYPRSTAEASAFPATVTRISTLVRERMAATVTARASAGGSTDPTPPPESTPTPGPGSG